MRDIQVQDKPCDQPALRVQSAASNMANDTAHPPVQGDDTKTSFWNMNMPSELHTKDCPDYLRYAFTNDKDRQMLSTPDAEYQRLTWQQVKNIINDNRLEAFLRVPSDLRKYREYCAKLNEQHGSVMEFVLNERLRWTDLTPTAGPFECADDYKILFNDWPYGIDERIVHLVVWTKFELPAEPITSEKPKGDLTPECRRQINEFVDQTFVRVCGGENVIWFKNWASLKSIHAVEHFHVMLFDPNPEFVKDITMGDVPMVSKIGQPAT